MSNELRTRRNTVSCDGMRAVATLTATIPVWDLLPQDVREEVEHWVDAMVDGERHRKAMSEIMYDLTLYSRDKVLQELEELEKEVTYKLIRVKDSIRMLMRVKYCTLHTDDELNRANNDARNAYTRYTDAVRAYTDAYSRAEHLLIEVDPDECWQRPDKMTALDFCWMVDYLFRGETELWAPNEPPQYEPENDEIYYMDPDDIDQSSL